MYKNDCIKIAYESLKHEIVQRQEDIHAALDILRHP